MRSILHLLCLVCVIAMGVSACAQTGSEPMETIPSPPREFRGAWIATVANIDWPSRSGLTVEQQKAELLEMLDRAADMNLNAIVFQVRPACDAFYQSDLEPWSEYLTGESGKAPEPFYDPLQFAIEESHKRGMELHAWFNPYRAKHPSAKTNLAASHIGKTRPDLAKTYGRYLWLDPGEKEVQDHSINVMMDVVRRYDLDGIHIDDYFYPYKERDADGNIIPFPDEPSWQRYRQGGGTLSRDDWRRQNVNLFVQRIYEELKREKPWVRFGVSPFGIYRPGHPPGITGFDQFTELYADARLWFHEGWLDYWTPQLYWPIDQKAQSYPVLLDYWIGENRKGRHIWPGNFTSKILENWDPKEIINQVRLTQQRAGATGNVHFSIKALTRNPSLLANDLKKEVYQKPALVPATPWLDSTPPERPELEVQRNNITGVMTAQWKAGGQKPVRFWVYYYRDGNIWDYKILPASTTEFRLTGADGASYPFAIAVSAISLTGVESPLSYVNLKPGALQPGGE